jgi:hypothetical protein
VPRAHEIAGSNPAVLTYCGGTRAGTGRRLLTAPTQVRFLPPQLCALGRAAKVPAFQAGEAGSIPAGHSRGSANGRLPGFEPGDAGSSPAPRTLVIDAGSSNGRTGRSERSGVGSIPAPATLKTEVIRPDEEPVSKTGAVTPLWVRVPRLPLRNKTVPWSSGNDSWPTPRQRRFKSVRDY